MQDRTSEQMRNAQLQFEPLYELVKLQKQWTEFKRAAAAGHLRTDVRERE
jgi:hypothetical protein